jgi:hypothetical protein
MARTRARDGKRQAAVLRDAVARLGAAQAEVRAQLARAGWSAQASLLDMRIGGAIADIMALLDADPVRRGSADASETEQQGEASRRSRRNGPKRR